MKRGDTAAAADLARAIEHNGGIKTYQAASKQGQSNDRGGDSSRVLVHWLQQSQVVDCRKPPRLVGVQAPLTCLEVGALSPTNQISKFPGLVDMTRIDLNSQGLGIQKQDFMQRPLPATQTDCFDLISLSLVLNYVPDPVGRGEMLKRITNFFPTYGTEPSRFTAIFPALFLVLPRPCVDNSRYLDEEMLQRILANLGFVNIYTKRTSKLCYYLVRWAGTTTSERAEKKKVRDGSAMNNFCIIVN